MCFFYLIKQLNEGSVKFGLGHFLKESVHSKVNDPITQGTDLSSQSTSHITLTATCSPGYKYVFGSVNKQSIGKLHELIRRYVTRRIAINLLKDSIVPKLTLFKIKLSLLIDPVLQFRFCQTSNKKISRDLLMHRNRECRLVGSDHSMQL